MGESVLDSGIRHDTVALTAAILWIALALGACGRSSDLTQATGPAPVLDVEARALDAGREEAELDTSPSEPSSDIASEPEGSDARLSNPELGPDAEPGRRDDVQTPTDSSDAAADEGVDVADETSSLEADTSEAETDAESIPEVSGDAAPEESPVVRFAALGDTGKANSAQYQVGQALAAKCKADGCDFVVLLGDNFYDSGVSSESDAQFKSKFEDPYQDVDAPFFIVLGNHDYGGEGAGYELWKADYYKKYSQANTKFVLPDTHWQKVIGHVQFFGMDSNLMMYGLGKPQVDELLPQLAASTSTWKVGFAHHPFLSNGKHGNAGTYEGIPGIPIVSGDGVKQAYQKVVCGHMDVHIAGHDHSRQWLKTHPSCAGTELLVSGAGASTTEVKSKDYLFNKVNPAWYADADKEGFLWVEIDGKTFRGEFIDLDGNTSFVRTFSKP